MNDGPIQPAVGTARGVTMAAAGASDVEVVDAVVVVADGTGWIEM